ncbi:probable disease resistance protein at5g66910 [Phtheirospermum japonicum]|uniref:Probable disease resistance protein at5g66910 n=1 Tax=Phtheirospermum japonicum TaxID=374723 RepID=A0A830DF23_9LAMI|nr:probable disease resistance protein at5g66910 [Phtheirospermum japonicum]
MEALICGSALGAAFELLFTTVIDAAQKAANFNSDLRRLKSTLDSIKLAIGDIQRFDRILETPPLQTKMLADQLNRGASLVRKCVDVKRNVFKKLYYSRKLSKLDFELLRFFQTELQVFHLRETKKVSVGVNQIAAQLERSVIGGPSSNRFAGWCSAPGPPDFVVGLENPLEDVRGKLLEDGGNVLVVSAPGGCGKTTLAKKVCHDETIRGNFIINYYFFIP